MKNKLKGFTLIELLVVVSIIGILASVILASLSTSKNKGGDAAIKNNLLSVRAQAEIIHTGSGCYGDNNPVGETTCAPFTEGTCTFATANTLFANAIVATQIQGAVKASGGAAANAVCSSEASGRAWAVAVVLKSDTGAAWCIDSSGTSKSFTGTPADAITLNKCN